MNTSQITKQIRAILTEMDGPVATRYLMSQFGAEQTTAALDAMVAERMIIRVRGQGATVELN